jgi:ABC-2 type transport system ATP-binding protein
MTVNEHVLEVSALQCAYAQHVVLRGVELNIRRGEWFTLLGPNGSGKSTLLQAVAGIVRPRSGSLRVCGHSIVDERICALHRLGFACAPDKLPGLLTGHQCLQIYAAAKGLTSADAVLTLADALKLSPWLDTCVDTWSLGTRQKLCVLLALLGKPSLIVLDEAFNGLDPSSALALKRHLRARVDGGDTSVLLATHSLDIVTNFSDRAGLLLDGVIARMWDREALNAMQSGRAPALEIQLAAAAEGDGSGIPRDFRFRPRDL